VVDHQALPWETSAGQQDARSIVLRFVHGGAPSTSLAEVRDDPIYYDPSGLVVDLRKVRLELPN